MVVWIVFIINDMYRLDVCTLIKFTWLNWQICSETSAFTFQESLETQRDDYRKWKLSRIADINNKRCDLQPLFGQDLQATVNIYKDFRPNCDKTRWKSLGYLYCHDVHHSTSRTDNYWRRTSALSNAVNTPEQYLKKLEDVLRRWVMHYSKTPTYTHEGSLTN